MSRKLSRKSNEVLKPVILFPIDLFNRNLKETNQYLVFCERNQCRKRQILLQRSLSQTILFTEHFLTQ